MYRIAAIDMNLNYWLFAGVDHYASGGMQNFKGRYATHAVAREQLKSLSNTTPGGFEWYQIVDVEQCKIVQHFRGGGYGTEWSHDGSSIWPSGVTSDPEDVVSVV